MPQIAETGFLVAYWSKKDTHHRWARGLSVTAPLRTCEAVLTEAAYRTLAGETSTQHFSATVSEPLRRRDSPSGNAIHVQVASG